MSTASLGKKEYQLLGKLLMQRHPEIAGEFLSSFIDVKSIETDLAKITDYFIVFCTTQDIEPDDYRGNVYKSDKVDIRRQFVSCMLHLYCPGVFIQPSDGFILRNKFLTEMSYALDMDRGYMCRVIREVIIREKVYQDYREEVSNRLQQLQKK